MSNEDIEYQAQLAVEHMSSENCKGCKWYVYGKEDHQCLFHSAPIDECDLVQLAMIGELHDRSKS